MKALELSPLLEHFHDDRRAAQRYQETEKNGYVRGGPKEESQRHDAEGGDDHLQGSSEDHQFFRLEKTFERILNSNSEQEKNYPDFCNQFDDLSTSHKSQDKRSDKDSGEDIPDNKRYFEVIADKEDQ